MTRTIEARQRAGETEKMTLNVGVVDLGQVDLLVQEGFYSNRSDLMRTALRNLQHELRMGPVPVERCLDCGPGA